MTPNVLKWIEALESGRFVQGRNRLTKNGQDCCLGVACKVAMENGVHLDTIVDPDTIVSYNNEKCSLPHSVMRWLGLKPGRLPCLIRMNDGEGLNFTQIASYLRTHEKEIFTEGGPTP